MGLDTVEIVMRAEEVFSIDLPDEECGLVITVGDLYRLVLRKLDLSYVSIDQTQGVTTPAGRNRLKDQYPNLVPWNHADVWATLTGIIHDQLTIDYDEITEKATFQDDLRCD